jgi:hypothetical protein
VSITEKSRLRLERITSRYAARQAAAAEVDARAAFEREFTVERDERLVPLLHELGAELRRAGHDYALDFELDPRQPNVQFLVTLAGARPRYHNVIGFFTKHPDGAPSYVVAYLRVTSEFELIRFHRGAEMTRDVLEQVVVDALEQMLACNQ